MRKITAIAVALGFLTSVSLPAYATPAVSGIVKSDELSAAKKKKAKTSKKKADLAITDLSAAKKKGKKAKKEEMKKSDFGTTDLSAAKKKSSKKKKTGEILYRIAA